MDAFILLIVLGIVYMSSKMKKKEEEDKKNIQVGKNKVKKYKDYKTESIMNFMEFDTVVDNMISQKDGMRYIMVVECQGINYDLMSGLEKNSVEQGFLQFLNTLRDPIQIYIQTRTVNLSNSIDAYKERVDEISKSFPHIRMTQ